MKSVDFTVQRLIGTTSDPNAELQYRARYPTDGKRDHVTSDDVVAKDLTVDEERSTGTGARFDDYDDSTSRLRHEAPLMIQPSLYLDYARQFLWQLTAACRPREYCVLS